MSLGANYSRISYVNDGSGGRYLPHPLATTSIDDRGLLFSDGVYEVMAAENGIIIDEAAHYKRLARSLNEMEIKSDFSINALRIVVRELLRRNNLKDAAIYIQVTRGIAKRDHYFPKDAKPTLLMTAWPLKNPGAEEIAKGVSVITHEDIRWLRRDIKSISLLPNVIAKQKSKLKGAKEAWLVYNGIITEGSSTNAYIIDKGGAIITHPKTNLILGGITRETVLELARKNKIKVIEKTFSLKDVLAAKEAFLTSTTAKILPVVKIDGKNIGGGNPGPLTIKMIGIYNRYIDKAVGR